MSDLPGRDAWHQAVLPAEGGVRLRVHVIPRARRTGIDGVRDGRILVRTTAPPVDDAANTAVIALLATALEVPRRQIGITAGARRRKKIVSIANVTVDRARARLAGGKGA